jgi:hypothetical protein
MTDFLYGLVSLAPVALAGCLVLSTLDREGLLRPIERLALGYGIGSGLLVWEMLLFHAFGLSFSMIGLLAPLLGTSAIAFLSARSARRHRPIAGRPESRLAATGVPLQKIEWFFIAAIALELSGTFFQAWLLPMEAYDAVSNWGLKAKAIFLAGGIPESFLRNPNYEVFHPDYPLLVPLLESYVYRCVAGLREPSVKMVFPLFLAGCVAILFAALRRAGQTRRSCLLFSFLLVSVPYLSEQATNGYADVVVTFYFGAGSLYLYLWQTTGRNLFLVLSALLTACAALTKNEGLLLVGIHLVWLAVVLLSRSGISNRSKLSCLGLYICILAVVLMPWYRFHESLGRRNDVINSEAVSAGLNWGRLNRVGPILYHLQTQVFGPKNWNLIWILFCAAVALRRRVMLRLPAVLFVCAVGLTVAAYMSVYLITPYGVPPFDVTWHLRTSASRLLIHVLSQVVFLIGLAFGEMEKV